MTQMNALLLRMPAAAIAEGPGLVALAARGGGLDLGHRSPPTTFVAWGWPLRQNNGSSLVPKIHPLANPWEVAHECSSPLSDAVGVMARCVARVHRAGPAAAVAAWLGGPKELGLLPRRCLCV